MGVSGWLGRLIRSGSQSDTDVREELRFHVEERVEELVAAGVPEAEARGRVEAEFGDVERIEAETQRVARQRVSRLRWRDRLERVGQDLRYTVRVLTRSPAFALAALLTLALGIGATTAVFTVVDAVLIRPLPVPNPDRLVVVWESSEEEPRDPTSPPNFQDFRAGAGTFQALAAWEDESPTLTGIERPRVVSAAGVSSEFFEVVGVPPVVGRTLGPGDEPGVAVISHRLWQMRFDGDPSAVGRTIELEGVAIEVVGVMPPEFVIPRKEIDLWLAAGIERREDHRSSRYLQMLGRLRPGVTPAEAEAELGTVAARLAAEYPVSNGGYGVVVVPAQDEVVGEAAGLLTVVLAAVALLLLLAAVNVSNMLLGRAAARGHEYAVRSALGASAARLRGQLLVESLVLGVVAGAIGVAIAWAGVEALLRLEPDAIPRAAEVGLDYRILAFALVVSAAASIIAGVVPGVRAARVGPAPALRDGGRGGAGSSRDGVRRALIVAELALSLVLLIGAGLLFRTFVALRSVDPGYTTENVLTAKVNLSGSRYSNLDSRVQYFDALLERARSIPGVAAAGITTTIPLSPAGIDFNLPYRREGDPPVSEEELPEADYRIISADYIDAVGMRLLRGRDLAPTDRPGATRVVLINRSFADRLWPGEDPIGRRVVIHYIAEEGLAWEVVGVVEDTRHQGLAAEPTPQFFVPMGQAEWLFNYMTVVVRATGSLAAVTDAVRSAATQVDPAEPIYDLETLAQLRSGAMARERLAATLIGLFALLALALSAAGVYGVVSYQVARRTREIGVRMAMGAARGRVLGLVVGEAAITAAIGLAIGLAGALATSRLLEGLLYGVEPLDPATYATVSGLLMASAIVAAWVPARRAAAVDPVTALRAD